MANELDRLQTWYLSQCNGDWEHTYGVTIENIDNPGLTLAVQLGDTDLQDTPFEPHVVERSDADWIHCAVSDMQFRGSGGAQKFNEILGVFLDWAEKHDGGASAE
jgi:hypothetical protein